MRSQQIPFELLSNTAEHRTPDPIYICDYQSAVVSVKSRIVLSHHLFNFLLAGEKSVYYTGSKAVIDPSKFILLSSGNCLMSEKTADQNGLYKSILLFFDNQVLSDFFIKHPAIVKASGNGWQDTPFFVFEKDGFLENFIGSLSLLLASGQEPTREMQMLKFEEVMLYLCSKYPSQVLALRSHLLVADEDAEIRKAMESNLENNITVEELAFLCNISVSTFKRRFARIYGTSPNKWMLQKRMERAATLLQGGTAKASDVYYRVGYENLSSFIQSFKQVYGVTPKKYQEQI